MVSLVQQAQYLTKYLLIIVLCVLFSCNQEDKNVSYYDIPKVYVAETNLKTTGGITYNNDNPYSGWSYSLYPTGDTESVIGYYKGKQENKTIRWYSNRLVAEVRWYHDGKKTGLHQGWFENSKKKFEYNLRDDQYEGIVKEWFENGLLCKNFNYTNGQEEGMQRMYWDNGKIRANYQVLKGRKYGLTGVKNCVSVWDDSAAH